MKKLVIAFCGSLISASAVAPAIAQPATWSLDARIRSVEAGLDKGVADGAITRAEYYNATHVVHEIQKHEREWLRTHGGQLDPAASQRFETDLDNVISQTHWTRQEWRRPW